MLIGELVERSGLTKDTIRFYEKKGLIALDKKSRRENNYKEYPEVVLDKLLLIRRLKELGFTLNEVDTFVDLWRAEDASCKNLKHLLEDKITLVNEQIQRLNGLKTRLNGSLAKRTNDDCEFEKNHSVMPLLIEFTNH
jgi:DNA-binding transcriptional MerR regulator